MKKIVCCLLLLFVGCAKSIAATDQQNVIALADKQRESVMKETRAATYFVYSDRSDPRYIFDEEQPENVTDEHVFLDAVRKILPTGTAFGVNAKGLIVTAAHVITMSYCTSKKILFTPGDPEELLHPEGIKRKAKTTETYCTLITPTYQKAFRAKVVFIDEREGVDTALLQIVDPPKNLPYLQLATTEELHEGAEVFTLGAPRGDLNLTTFGIVSNIDYPKSRDNPIRVIRFQGLIQPGNSGGALVSSATGKVVGMVNERSYVPAIAPMPDKRLGVAQISTGMANAIRADTIANVLKKFAEAK